LDISDFGSGRFILEVSSPGLDRKFFSDSDYGRFLGQLAKVTWKSSEMVHKQTVVGRLEAYSDSQREIVLKNESNDEAYTVSLNDIQMARLEPEI